MMSSPQCKHCGNKPDGQNSSCDKAGKHEFIHQKVEKTGSGIEGFRAPSKRKSYDSYSAPVDNDQPDIVTGWHSTAPCPNQKFEEGVESKNGRLFYFGMDLAQLADGKATEGSTVFPGKHFSLSITYLPAIRQRVRNMVDVFARVSVKLNYPGTFTYAYASKANAHEEVMRAAREAGAHQETSACYDLHVMVKDPELLPPGRKLICNGFKLPGSTYSNLLCQLLVKNPDVIPMIEDPRELDAYAALQTKHKIQVGIRLKCWGPFETVEEMAKCDCRFGVPPDKAHELADKIKATANVELKVLHAMVGSPVPRHDLHKLLPPLQIYAELKKNHPTLDTFDFGGGTPAAFVLSEKIDYDEYVTNMLQIIQGECARYDVPVPHLIGEFGRYTVSNHGIEVFSLAAIRPNGGPVPYYVINGSVMSSFPDTWALKEHFTCLPLNNLDKPFHQVRIGGLTCDSGDMYPPLHTKTKLFLPDVKEEDNLWVGFFNIGAYQEMLGGVGGAKHCGIPEADELCIDFDPEGHHLFEIFPGQTMDDVCSRLGYQFAKKHPHTHGVRIREKK